MTDLLPHTLAAALKRVVPYLDRLPDSAAAEVRAALDAYSLRAAAVRAAGESGGEEQKEMRRE